MILNSNATRNEDRFNAILPSWTKNSHLIKDKNTISNWNIANITPVRLKLYEIMHNLWDIATLLYAYSLSMPENIVLSSYTSQCYHYYLKLMEKDDPQFAYRRYTGVFYVGKKDKEEIRIKGLINDYKTKIGSPSSIYAESLIGIQLNYHHQHYLSVKLHI